MKEIKVGKKVRYIGHNSEYIGDYKVVYANDVSVALENEDLLILGFDNDVFLKSFTNSEEF